MKILKFGSSCLSSGKRIETIAHILSHTSKQDEVAVVLSTLKGITSLINNAAVAAESGENSYLEDIDSIREKHLEAIHYLFPAREQAKVITPIQIILNDLEDILHGVQLIGECSQKTLDLLFSYGVRLSCILVSLYLEDSGLNAVVIDAREIIQTNENYGNALVDFKTSYQNIRRRFARSKGIPVITGGIASTRNSLTTTLGADGSDYTASLVGAAVQAQGIEIWTDVDGVMSADPVYIPEAFVIPALSYQEAMELSFFGAKILHSPTIIPAMEMNIPIRIANLLKPEKPGTIISGREKKNIHQITGIASIDGVALVNIEGGGMIGIPGIAARILSALAGASINIIMISQASSEHSICLVFRQSEAKKAINILNQELSTEIEARRIQELVLMENLAILAIIGENMRGTPGISGKLFSSLGKAGINILAIAQGSSERNISFMIRREDEKKALQTIHRAFLGKEE